MVEKYLEFYSDNTKKSILTVIAVALKNFPHDVDPATVHYYQTRMIALSQSTVSNRKSEKQDSNWVSFDAICEHVALFKRESEKNPDDAKIILRYVILCLFTMISPRRNCDYHFMEEEIDGSGNYEGRNVLVLSEKKFYFGKYKTFRTYGVQSVLIPENLMAVIQKYIEFKRKRGWNGKGFLYDETGKELRFRPSNMINRIFVSIFSLLGKRIGCNMIRNIFATYKLATFRQQMLKAAENMGTSVHTLESTYIKEASSEQPAGQE